MLRQVTMNTLIRFATFFLVAAPFIQPQADRGWPEWRGPGRAAIVSVGQVPSRWPAAFTKSWTVPVGEGYASPVVSGGLAFIHSRQDPQEIVTAVEVATGKVRWRESYQAPFNKNGYALKMGKGPNATPLVTGGRLFVLGASGHLLALDAASGKRLWTKDFSSLIDTSKLFCGTAASPILANGAVVVQVGSDVRGGQIVALDPATGTERWLWKGDGPGYASPILVDAGGIQHLVTLTNKSIVGLNAKSGSALWSIPFPDEFHENIVTPVWTGRELIVSGIRQGTRAYRLAGAANGWTATEAWKNADVTMYMSSPVAGDGLIYGLSAKQKGQFVALDSTTGALKWASEGRQGEQASVLLAPGNVLFLTNTGALVIAKRTAAGFQEEKRYDISEAETWTTPVFLGGAMLVRDSTSLMRLEPK
jgi:outer membrane protein assembly factor BamB